MESHVDDIASLLYKDIFEVAPFGIYTLDAEGIITSYNPKMAELSGDTKEQVIGLNALELESYKKVGLDRYFRQGLTGEPFEVEVRYESAFAKKISDRSYKGIPIAGHGVPGEPRLLLIVEDITERKKILTEMEGFADFPRQNNNPVFRIDKKGDIIVKNNMVDDLIKTWSAAGDLAAMDAIKTVAARVIATRNREHLDERCGEVIYMFDVVVGLGEYANIYGHDVTSERHVQEMKDHFLSMASHELRTPMTIIGGYSNLILSGKTGEVNEIQRQYLEKISENTHKLLDFVNTMLDIDKLESGKFSMDLRRLDIGKIAKRTASEVSDLFRNDGVHLHVETESVFANVDAAQLDRAIINLLANALKFTPTGGDVWLSVHRSDTENEVIITVRDNGVGISAEDQPKLFNKYKQASSRQIHKMESTGLGLVINRELVTQMKGRIWVESQLGQGSAFFIALPAAD